MQLSKIKLAGFKSFVEPTTVLVPSQLVAVVGPNGCGKSNVIDAVCWVMGENSAKYLRGESLTDVIFNGSSSRKPVGQASVELLFNNSDGALKGEYAAYAEISIRRTLSREGDSVYYLNGTRCRRRDIIDVFLGTGLGPRSYSIIGQNMISRIIDAKPDDMRVYLEEAAGISKYKERRRETENRINHTKENLARLNDIRGELEKQLSHLQRQANSAEKFKTLKEQERTLRAQHYAIQWRELDAYMVDYTLQIQHQETGLEACQAELSGINLNLENRRADQRLSNESYQEVQQRYYLAGNEITRLEQDVRHAQERQEQLKQDIEQVGQDWQQIKEDLQQGEDEAEELTQETTQLEPALEKAKKIVSTAANELQQAEEAMQQWQEAWDEFNEKKSKATHTAGVEQTRIQHLEQRLASLRQRQTKLAAEQNQINYEELASEQKALSEKIEQSEELTHQQEEKLLQAREAITALQSTQQEVTNELNEVRNQLQQLVGEQSSLQALQQTALGQRDHRSVEWLAKHKLDQFPRLAQSIEVNAGWELAVEKVLGSYMQAVCIDQVDSIASSIKDMQEGTLSLFITGASKKQSENKQATLLSQVKSKWPMDSLLGNIYIADSLDDALKLSKTIEPNESVITQDGVWLGSHWLRVTRDKNPEEGVFLREQELKKINQQITQLSKDETRLDERLQKTREELADLERKREELSDLVNDCRSKSVQITAQQKIKHERYIELKKRSEQFVKEQEETTAQLTQTEKEIKQARSIWQEALHQLEQDDAQGTVLVKDRDELREQLQQCREKLNQAQQDYQSLEIRVQTIKSQQASLQQNLKRLQMQLDTLAERKAALDHEYDHVKSIKKIQDTLANALNGRLMIEGELQTKRATVEAIDQELRVLETDRQEKEREVSKFRDRLESLRMDCQGLKIKSENIIEQMQATHYTIEEILKQLPENATAQEWQAQLEQVVQRIARLGPINLVAIEEYSTCSERKQYLDKQHMDLQQGLATLEDAISKIDRETRARFKDTFDKVNGRFQELFPKVFGGGRASLELTSDNLLEAGVTVMACPPGKRNSTIHLLSGGEKALTAIALVFSIFHLNPAPFCLLDEVDAPLDDVNVNRFCQLVKEMSEKTQFLFISHNKLAIEMAEDLIGVTMNEPGVSRLVSVNIQEAIQMAGA